MKDEKVKIFCRFRPSLRTDENHVISASGASLYLTDVRALLTLTTVSLFFATFDQLKLIFSFQIQENAFEKVFRADASQEQVYNDVAKAAVTGILSFICETTSRNYDGGRMLFIE